MRTPPHPGWLIPWTALLIRKLCVIRWPRRNVRRQHTPSVKRSVLIISWSSLTNVTSPDPWSSLTIITCFDHQILMLHHLLLRYQWQSVPSFLSQSHLRRSCTSSGACLIRLIILTLMRRWGRSPEMIQQSMNRVNLETWRYCLIWLHQKHQTLYKDEVWSLSLMTSVMSSARMVRGRDRVMDTGGRMLATSHSQRRSREFSRTSPWDTDNGWVLGHDSSSCYAIISQ